MSTADTLETTAGTYTVRRARLDDLPALVALLADDDLAARRGDTAHDFEPYREAFAAIDDDPRQFLACLEAPDGAVVGTLQVTIIPGLSRRGATRAQVEAVRIAGRARGQGLGTHFMHWAIRHARQQGCGLVQLTTDVTRHDAHRFYERLGFEHSHHGLKLSLTPKP